MNMWYYSVVVIEIVWSKDVNWNILRSQNTFIFLYDYKWTLFYILYFYADMVASYKQCAILKYFSSYGIFS